MTTFEERADAYLAAWHEPDAGARAALLDRIFTDDAIWIDPMANLTGRAALNDHITKVQADFPGARFERTSAIDRHEGGVRYAWRMLAEDGTAVITGMDFVTLRPDGTFASVIGFFGELAPLEQAAR